MGSVMVQAPVILVLDPAISPPAKLIWMVLRLHEDRGPIRFALLVMSTGLSPRTVRKGLAELVGAGWCSATGGEHGGEYINATDRAQSGAGIQVPGDLLTDRRMGVRCRILYGYLQLTPEFRHPAGRFTHSFLSNLTRVSLPTVRRAVRELVETGWLEITQKNQLAPVRFCLRNPKVDRGHAEVERAERRLGEAPYFGEALMREYLSLLVESDDFEDNAAPGFLVNPWTDERMQLDRYYPSGVAFEFNGPQHYGATDQFSGEKAARQRGRDYMKLGICTTRGIRLVVINPFVFRSGRKGIRMIRWLWRGN